VGDFFRTHLEDLAMALVFLDLDGTTLDAGKPAPFVIETIADLKANGHLPVIATGRTPHLLYGIEKTLGIDSYIAANGGYISYHGQAVYTNFIKPETIERMIAYAERLKTDLVFESVDGYVAYSKRSQLVDQFSDIFQIEYPVVEPDYHKTHPLLAMIVFEDEHIEEFRQGFPELVFNRSNRFGYDVNPAGGLKAEGVEWLIRYLNYPQEDVYAIGDGYNDISMLSTVKHGIAMGNAYPETKAAAIYVTTSVKEGGVRDALLHYGLI
jgi:Cof subfamily protein (haloacid dehalogenase superfamily)